MTTHLIWGLVRADRSVLRLNLPRDGERIMGCIAARIMRLRRP
ncbi:MAG: hypothetical protein AAFX05_04870 [Planctomycetota bacterium]